MYYLVSKEMSLLNIWCFNDYNLAIVVLKCMMLDNPKAILKLTDSDGHTVALGSSSTA